MTDLTQIKVIEKVNSAVDDVTKYIVQDDQFGKNEISVIRKADKIIFCMPTQTNCKMGCTFCHLTGTTRPAHNLTSEWIVGAVDFLVAHEYKEESRDLLISFMGVGEPLMNVDNLTQAIDTLHNKYQRIRFGISTMLPNMRARDKLIEWIVPHPFIRLKLHFSVHGVLTRNAIVNSSIGAVDAIKAICVFHVHTGRPIEFHYTLVAGVNDSVDELSMLSKLVATKSEDVTVKFLTLSETNGCQATKMSQEAIRELFPNNIVEFYDPPGRDVGSSCGMFNRDLYNISKESTDANT